MSKHFDKLPTRFDNKAVIIQAIIKLVVVPFDGFHIKTVFFMKAFNAFNVVGLLRRFIRFRRTVLWAAVTER